MDTEKISGESHHSVESCALSFSGCKDWLTKNTKNVGALTNLYALKNMCKAEEDSSQLPGAHSLSLNSAYEILRQDSGNSLKLGNIQAHLTKL